VVSPVGARTLALMQRFRKDTTQVTKVQRYFPNRNPLFGKLVPLLGLVGV